MIGIVAKGDIHAGREDALGGVLISNRMRDSDESPLAPQRPKKWISCRRSSRFRCRNLLS